MENYQASGEDIERALMDLGPLLGVSIKEETPDELPDAPGTSNNSVVTAEATAKATSEAASPEEGAGSGSSGGGAGDARCVVCALSLLTAEGTPKLMECLHSICEPCLRAKIEERRNLTSDYLGAERISITCPACRLQCQPANMIDQRFVMEKIAQEQLNNATDASMVGPQQCNSCEETEPATSYCVECSEFICDNCVRAHQRLKITKDHTIKSKEEAVLELQAAQSSLRDANEMFCSEHTQERLSLFCETCDRLTCRDCQLQRHRDHKYQFSTEMAAQARSTLSQLVSEVGYKRVLLGSAMRVIRDRQALIADKKKALVREITNAVVKLTNAINTRGKELVLRLNEVCDAKLGTLGDKRAALEQLASITDHALLFVRAALHQGSDTAVLYSKRAVCAQLQRIKSRRADIPNPEIPVRISLHMDNLNELIKVLSSIGNIVVDGKMDGPGGGAGSGGGGAGGGGGGGAMVQHGGGGGGGGGGVGGAAHSAVVALQHVAMQQSYVQCRSGGASPVGSSYGGGGVGGVPGGPGVPGGTGAGPMMRAPLTPLRHPHVTSTTHPHHTHGMSEVNLRGLLNPSSMQRRANMQQPLHHYHPMMYSSAYAAQAQAALSSRRAPPGPPSGPPALSAPPSGHSGSGGPSGHSGHSAHSAHSAGPHGPHAKWHIPQHGHTSHGGGYEPTGVGSSPGHEYKITLGRPTLPALPPPPSAVTSTNPKTPSPALSGSLELELVCAQSVQELMATIAKLDSNGVQVLPETGAGATPPASTSVTTPTPTPNPAPTLTGVVPPGTVVTSVVTDAPHSSTGDLHVGKSVSSGVVTERVTGGTTSSDPNEDWCAVCMDGGELMCCDKCPKVFHQYCHIPTIDKLPSETETWQCLLCVNFAEVPPSPDEMTGGAAGGGVGGVTPREQKIMERITLEMYCQYEASLPFREPVPLNNTDYYSKITRPMCLDGIRRRLQPATAAPYSRVTDFLADCRLLFRNALAYNPPDSQIYKDAKRLEEFFDAQLLKWLPQYAYWQEPTEPRPGLDAGPLHKKIRLE